MEAVSKKTSMTVSYNLFNSRTKVPRQGENNIVKPFYVQRYDQLIKGFLKVVYLPNVALKFLVTPKPVLFINMLGISLKNC